MKDERGAAINNPVKNPTDFQAPFVAAVEASEIDEELYAESG